MKNLLLLTLLFPLLSTHLSAYEFKFIKLRGDLEEHALKLNKKNQMSLHKANALSLPTSLTNTKEDIVKDDTTSLESPLFKKIMAYLGPNYEKIAQTQLTTLLQQGGTFDFGKENFSGITWQKPMGHFSIGVDRQLAPDLFDDKRWIVTDTFIIQVDAYSYLSNLLEENRIDITKDQLGAFAGIGFTRIYTSTHFANNYMQGLTGKIDKLFLGFLPFTDLNVTDFSPYEFASKEDSFSYKLGGLIHVPTPYQLAFDFGAFISKKSFSKVTIQSLGDEDIKQPDEQLRVSIEKEETKSIEATAALQVELFELLKLDLLRYEYSYTFGDAYKSYLSFNKSAVIEMQKKGELAQTLSKLVRFQEVAQSKIAPYIVSKERRTKEVHESKYGLLMIFGGMKKGQTEQIIIQKGTEYKKFFKANFENIKYVKSFINTLLNTIGERILKLNLFKSAQAERVRRLEFEYDGSEQVTLNPKTARLKSPNQMSFKMIHRYSVEKTSGSSNSLFRDYAVEFIKNQSELSVDLVNAIKSERLKGPLNIETTYMIKGEGLRYFKTLPRKIWKRVFVKFCDWDPDVKYFDHRKSAKGARGRVCFEGYQNSIESFKKDWDTQHDFALWKFKNVLEQVLSVSDSKHDLYDLFGAQNVFAYGSLKAITSENTPFATYYKRGELTSLGVIDDYKREKSMIRAPASIEL